MIRSSRNVGLGTHQDADGKKQPVEEPGENMEEVNKEDCVSCTQSWITVGLPDSASSSSEAICYITCPLEVIKLISCKVVDGLSSLLVSGSEELVSSVLRIEKPISTKCPFPITVAVPFQACYRGNYREVTVKVVDQEQRVSYVTPAATEGNYGGHRGSFAVVRVYTLGIFAVVSQFQRETFTIPKRGLSIKLSVDSRICLDYLPGSYNTPVVAQAMVQPVDTIMLSMLKSRNDSYYSILTTSPLLYLHHPSGLAPRRPLAITLPCPPNPDKKKTGEESNNGPGNTALIPDTFLYHQNRVLSAPGKSSKDLSKEQLVVLGWREEQWNLLDKTSVRNLQNSLVSFELMENFERVIVLRLLPSARPSDLTFFADNLEESVRTCSVTAVLHSRLQDPSSTVLAVLPSRELSWGLADLHVQNYRGPPEPSTEFFMKEGEQLLLKFSGNITSTADDQGTTPHTVTFHSQRRNWLHLKLKEKDPFGNYSSPHYKGTVLLFRIPRDQLFWRGDRVLIHQAYSLEEPVCKLSLTLPKEVKTLCRPMSAYILQHGQTESLCDKLLEWLCGELSEEDAALLVMCLQLRRSSVQLARLRAPDSFSLQTFHILTAWRRALPSSIPKRPLLARCLSRIGRAELAAELLRRDTAVEDGGSRDAETQRLN
ncbi:death domain-containing protein 1 [Hoplias malabaricus]|uniref:death domain-containing protein 1 n=1 Tax=Hoplias malabaricus TaxID=27720 RepID=UPI003463770F